MLFINESQFFSNIMMWERGYLEGHGWPGAFPLSRSNDLIWSRIIHDWLSAARRPFQSISWPGTPMRHGCPPHALAISADHFLNNDLARGRFEVAGRSVALRTSACPLRRLHGARPRRPMTARVFKLHSFDRGSDHFCPDKWCTKKCGHIVRTGTPASAFPHGCARAR